MNLRAETVTGKSKQKKRIKEIYMSSFPKEDRMPFWLMRIMSKMKHTGFLSFYDMDTLCGFIYMATIQNLTFIMFFAVKENVRSKGYGSRILNQIESMYPDSKLIISIERCDVDAKDIEQRLRRKEFYYKNGYTDTGYLIELSNMKQEIIIKNGKFDGDEFALFFKKYSNGKMKPIIQKKDS